MDWPKRGPKGVPMGSLLGLNTPPFGGVYGGVHLRTPKCTGGPLLSTINNMGPPYGMAQKGRYEGITYVTYPYQKGPKGGICTPLPVHPPCTPWWGPYPPPDYGGGDGVHNAQHHHDVVSEALGVYTLHAMTPS